MMKTDWDGMDSLEQEAGQNFPRSRGGGSRGNVTFSVPGDAGYELGATDPTDPNGREYDDFMDQFANGVTERAGHTPSARERTREAEQQQAEQAAPQPQAVNYRPHPNPPRIQQGIPGRTSPELNQGQGMQGTQSKEKATPSLVSDFRDSFADGGNSFDQLEQAIDEQSFMTSNNSKYLEFKQQQNANGGGALKNSKKTSMARTSTIVGNDEIVAPVLSSRVLSLGFNQYQTIKPALSLQRQEIDYERKQSQREFKAMLDSDKMSEITHTRRPAPRLDPGIEKTGFMITAQMQEPPRTAERRQTKVDWREQLKQDQNMHKVEIPRKVLQRRAFTPFAQYSPQKDKAGLLETDSIQAAFKKGEEHRDHLRHNRQDLISKMEPAERLNLQEMRKAKGHVGGAAAYYERIQVQGRLPSRYGTGLNIGETDLERVRKDASSQAYLDSLQTDSVRRGDSRYTKFTAPENDMGFDDGSNFEPDNSHAGTQYY